jgi:hypothetical protein
MKSEAFLDPFINGLLESTLEWLENKQKEMDDKSIVAQYDKLLKDRAASPAKNACIALFGYFFDSVINRKSLALIFIDEELLTLLPFALMTPVTDIIVEYAVKPVESDLSKVLYYLGLNSEPEKWQFDDKNPLDAVIKDKADAKQLQAASDVCRNSFCAFFGKIKVEIPTDWRLGIGIENFSSNESCSIPAKYQGEECPKYTYTYPGSSTLEV